MAFTVIQEHENTLVKSQTGVQFSFAGVGLINKETEINAHLKENIVYFLNLYTVLVDYLQIVVFN